MRALIGLGCRRRRVVGTSTTNAAGGAAGKDEKRMSSELDNVYGIHTGLWERMTADERWEVLMPIVRHIARRLDFESAKVWWWTSWLRDSYGVEPEDDPRRAWDNTGRDYWITDDDPLNLPITVRDFLEVREDLSWDDVNDVIEKAAAGRQERTTDVQQ
jgi:hypothetical protein